VKSTHVGMGVIICEDVIDVDQEFFKKYISALRDAKENTFTYIEEGGITYAVNATGFKFNVEDIAIAPQRFLNTRSPEALGDLVNEAHEFINKLENAIYDALVEYCRYFPDAATTAWWRPLGHLAGYENGQKIGPHCDDQVPFEWGQKTGNQVSMHNSTSINLYLNDCVESTEELDETNFIGGELCFPHVPYKWKPKSGSVIAYPSNYVGRHEVLPVTHGQRYAYLSMACYGTSFTSEEVIGQDNPHRIWMPNLIEDSRHNLIKS